MKSATEIIENLYKCGHISFDEAITLGINSRLGDGCESKLVHDKVDKIQQMTVDKLVETLFNECCNEFHIEECVNYMNSIGWKWHNVQNKITVDDFKNEMYHQVGEVIHQMLDYVKEHNMSVKDMKESDKEFVYSTAGFTTTAYFDSEKGSPFVEIEFCADSGCAGDNISAQDIINIVNTQ